VEAAAAAPKSRKIVLAPAGTLAAGAEDAIRTGCDALEREAAAAAAGEIEPIHQLRVATRRLRAALELFSHVINANQQRILVRDLGWIAQTAGAVRECDIMAETIHARSPKLDDPLAAALATLYGALEERRRGALKVLAELLGSDRFHAMAARLRAPRINRRGTGAPLGPAAAGLLQPVVRSIRRAGAKLGDDAPSEVVHRLRVRIKRLRYELEMLSALGGKRNRKALKRLEAMQDLLGTYNDVCVTIAWLVAYPNLEGAAPEAVLAAGATAQSLAGRKQKLSRRCIAAWRKFERSEIITDVIAEIRRAAHQAVAAESAPVNLP
jgi:CHAD domain-containing protein